MDVNVLDKCFHLKNKVVVIWSKYVALCFLVVDGAFTDKSNYGAAGLGKETFKGYFWQNRLKPQEEATVTPAVPLGAEFIRNTISFTSYTHQAFLGGFGVL